MKRCQQQKISSIITIEIFDCGLKLKPVKVYNGLGSRTAALTLSISDFKASAFLSSQGYFVIQYQLKCLNYSQFSLQPVIPKIIPAYHIMQIVRSGKVSRLHDILVIRQKTFAIVQQFETSCNKKGKIRWKTFAIGG